MGGPRDSVLRRSFQIFVFVGFTAGLAALSFWWSLGQTIDFTNLIFLDQGNWGVIAGIIVQFGPQVFLFLADEVNGESQREKDARGRWFALFWLFTGFDALTNIGARLARISAGTLPVLAVGDALPEFATATTWLMVVMGFGVDIVVVFAEEMIGHALSALAQNISGILTLLGYSPPAWLGMVDRVSRTASGQRRSKKRSSSGSGSGSGSGSSGSSSSGSGGSTSGTVSQRGVSGSGRRMPPVNIQDFSR